MPFLHILRSESFLGPLFLWRSERLVLYWVAALVLGCLIGLLWQGLTWFWRAWD